MFETLTLSVSHNDQRRNVFKKKNKNKNLFWVDLKDAMGAVSCLVLLLVEKAQKASFV